MSHLGRFYLGSGVPDCSPLTGKTMFYPLSMWLSSGPTQTTISSKGKSLINGET